MFAGFTGVLLVGLGDVTGKTITSHCVAGGTPFSVQDNMADVCVIVFATRFVGLLQEGVGIHSTFATHPACCVNALLII